MNEGAKGEVWDVLYGKALDAWQDAGSAALIADELAPVVEELLARKLAARAAEDVATAGRSAS